MSSEDLQLHRECATLIDAEAAGEQAVEMLLEVMADGLDHPELWVLVPSLLSENPLIAGIVQQRVESEAITPLFLLHGLCTAVDEGPQAALDLLMPLCAIKSQDVQVQGVIFHIEGLLDPANPKYDLEGKICPHPFIELDVLEGSTHLCCASWLPTSTGNLQDSAWADVWNSPTAQAIRASITDGSYRFCNKRTCPKIQSNNLTPVEAYDADPKWDNIIRLGETALPCGPEVVNLSYDRTCNLSCPSCRTKRYAADEVTRTRFDLLQEHAILPLLRDAKTVYVTGSGDPFASKNFRRLMEQLDAENYPDLKFIVMTNGMLFTPRQWEAFPSLHRRVQSLRISLDAATGPTHERLRRGARWSVMERNLRFAGELLKDGLIDDFMITFTVQTENYREMGDAVDLAHEIGASTVYFGRLTNWGTFSPEEYQRHAVFLPSHPEHEQFLAVCRDQRLHDAKVWPTDLDVFIRNAPAA